MNKEHSFLYRLFHNNLRLSSLFFNEKKIFSLNSQLNNSLWRKLIDIECLLEKLPHHWLTTFKLDKLSLQESSLFLLTFSFFEYHWMNPFLSDLPFDLSQNVLVYPKNKDFPVSNQKPLSFHGQTKLISLQIVFHEDKIREALLLRNPLKSNKSSWDSKTFTNQRSVLLGPVLKRLKHLLSKKISLLKIINKEKSTEDRFFQLLWS